MNFFEQQQLARRNTRTMLILYVLAVIAIVLLVELALGTAWQWGFPEIYGARVPGALYVWGAAATLAPILGATIYHVARLREGGEAIARLVGARRVLPDTRDTLERRLLNVVEEMAIAAGTRVPAVYVLHDEPGVNAFAAGFDTSSSAIMITRGALQTLNRDELQGMIGHEFSHIVSGDVRLDIRMMGVLGGIVSIGAIGGFLMRDPGKASGRRDSRAAGAFPLGLALYAVGYLGLFFARFIKATVTRQREFLADAASVRFTRNPTCVAGALDQLRASASGALIVNRYAEDLSHMLFGQGVKAWTMASLLETHPPIDERIRRVLPSFGAADYRARRTRASVEGPVASRLARTAFGKRAEDQAHPWGRSLEQRVALIGALEAAKVDYARRLMEGLSPAVRDAVRKREGAAAVMVALRLATHPPVMERQLAAAKAVGAAALVDAAAKIAPQVAGLPLELRAPVVDLALPTLRLMTPEARRELLAALEAAIRADRRVSLHEFVVLTVMRFQLAPPARAGSRRSLGKTQSEALLVLSLLAHGGRGAGASAALDVQTAFRAGARELGLPEAALVARDKLTMQNCSAALERLRSLAPAGKAELVRALFAGVAVDGKVRLSEAELMRLVGASLDCPIPPLFEAL